MVVGADFIANLNADKIYIDLTYLADPIKNKFWLTIQNQSLSTLYFKIICNIPNWSMDTPADGKLGSVASSVTTTFEPIVTRSNPGSETTDSGSLKIEAYTDSGYTNKIGEATLNVTVYIEDLENWTDVTKNSFDDGTAQGWTLAPAANMSISTEQSVEVGGYSARFLKGGIYEVETSISKSISLPNRNKVRVSFFLGYEIKGAGTYYYLVKYPYISADAVKVFEMPMVDTSLPLKTVGWLKLTADLSDYKGQTKTIKLSLMARTRGVSGGYVKIWYDRVVVAGKD